MNEMSPIDRAAQPLQLACFFLIAWTRHLKDHCCNAAEMHYHHQQARPPAVACRLKAKKASTCYSVQRDEARH
jgi:hypothetical protein